MYKMANKKLNALARIVSFIDLNKRINYKELIFNS